jgi:hypothetical protein
MVNGYQGYGATKGNNQTVMHKWLITQRGNDAMAGYGATAKKYRLGLQRVMSAGWK